MNDKIQNNAKLNEWDDIKIFRDPVHQYIEIPRIYVNYLIDTYEMQRIKDVAQSGLRSVFNTATHDRFSHSLGVYYLGRKAFASLKKNILNIVRKESFVLRSGDLEEIKNIEKLKIEEKLDFWEVLFHIACILHDIGHPAMSHTLEFLYDDIYMDLEPSEKSASVSLDEYRRFLHLRKKFINDNGNDKKQSIFKEQLCKKLLDSKDKSIKGNPHERMSAFYILLGVDFEKDSANKYIEKIPENCLAYNIEQIINSYKHYKNLNDTGSGNDNTGVSEVYDVHECLKFICYMIIGQHYDTDISCDSDIYPSFIHSIQNAIIDLLNSKIDVDSLDYISRNSYTAGYDTNSIDVNRLCTAFSVRFKNNVLIPVFEKNALSVLEGFISARNYEPRWLYSHHKIVYNIDVLYKCLFKYAVELLYTHDIGDWCSIILSDFMGEGKSLESCDFYKNYIAAFNYSCKDCKQENCSEQENCSKSEQGIFRDNEIDKIKNKIMEIGKAQNSSNSFAIYNLWNNLVKRDDEVIVLKVAQIQSIILSGKDSLNDNGEEFSDYVKTLLDDIKSYINNYSDVIGALLSFAKTCAIWEKSNAEGNTIRMEDNANDRYIDAFEKLVHIINKDPSDILRSSIKSVMMNTRAYLRDIIKNTNDHGELIECFDEFLEFITALSDRYSELIDIKNLYFSYILSPVRGFDNGCYSFYRSNDSDINALFKRLYINIKSKEEQKEMISKIEKEYCDIAKEYFDRKYKRSLWKSQQEYKVFLQPVSDKTGMSLEEINRYFIDLIRLGGKKVAFHNDHISDSVGDYENQYVYISYSKENNIEDRLIADKKYINEFNNLVSDFKGNFIMRIHTIKYKDFGKSVKIAFKHDIFNLSQIIDLSEPDSKEFPYIFVFVSGSKDKIKDKEEEISRYKDNLQKNLIKYCVSQHNKMFLKDRSEDIMMVESREGKIFRDVVHGDIEIPRKFLALIDTRAFQRLRRIKQLSTADLVFPNAMHTRFSHCIGTFYIMTLMVEHFKHIFQNLGATYFDEEIDALLVAALLHDIGHGPYSHNFERLNNELFESGETEEKQKTHEDWGAEIIEKDPEIREALKSGFSKYDVDEFIRLIKSYIKGDIEYDNKQLSFHMIFKSLISSQLDADRFDYLLRDSFNTGIVYGKIDVHSIIQNLKVTEYHNRFYVCIAENAVSYVEQFLFGRYKMYDSVYYNAYKVFTETLVIKILKYIRKNKNNLGGLLDSNLIGMIDGKLDVQKYITLDDSYINGLLVKWQESDDVILRSMCGALLHRKGYKRIYALNQTYKDYMNFRSELEKLFEMYLPGCDVDVKNLNSFIFADRNFYAYEYIIESEETRSEYISKIFVLTNDGLLKDFAEVSHMFYMDNRKNWYTYKCYIYYNKELLMHELDCIKNKPENFESKKTQLIAHIDQKIKSFSLRNHIEIEEKYTCSLNDINKVKNTFGSERAFVWDNEYVISGGADDDIRQIDVYYDTDDMILANNNCSLRCRSKDDNSYKVTIKSPTNGGGFDQESQVARFEYEMYIEKNDLVEAFDFICNTLRDIIDDKSSELIKDNFNEIFKPKLTVKNERKKYFISSNDSNSDFKFVVCLDNITFMHEGREEMDYQIEVELESDYIHRVSMKFFTDKLEKLLTEPVKHEKSSKYEKGLKIFKLLEK